MGIQNIYFEELTHEEMLDTDGGFIGCMAVGAIIAYALYKKFKKK